MIHPELLRKYIVSIRKHKLLIGQLSKTAAPGDPRNPYNIILIYGIKGPGGLSIPRGEYSLCGARLRHGFDYLPLLNAKIFLTSN